MSGLFACRCVALLLALAPSGSNAAILRGTASPGDGAVQTWTPPPEYLMQSMDHKTMYLVDVSIGKEGQSFRLLVDTGSSVLVVPSAACNSPACARHRRLNSSSAKGAGQTLSIRYGLGSLRGHILEDYVCMQGSGGVANLAEVSLLERGTVTSSVAAQVRSHSQEQRERDVLVDNDGGSCTRLSFLAADEESDEFAQLPYDGILGLGLDDMSKAGTGFSFLEALAKGGRIGSTSFALRLGSSGNSELLLGGIDEQSLAGGKALWVPLSPLGRGSWQFTVSDFTIDGKLQQFGSLEVTVDSGTSLLAADSGVKRWFQDHVQPKDCSEVDKLPALGLYLPGGSVLPLLPADYIDQVQGACELSLMPNKFEAVNSQRLILGDSFLRRYTAIFDRERARIGFGVDASDRLASVLLPAMFPTTTTTAAPTTSPGPPPALHLDYTNYQPETTPPPPTAEEVQGQELNQAFSKLPDDLNDDFDKEIAQQRASIKNSGIGHAKILQ